MVAATAGGLLIYDISNPSRPLFVSHLRGFGDAVDITLDGKLALLAAEDAGLVILDISNPPRPQLVSRTRVVTEYGEVISVIGVRANEGIAYLGTLQYGGVVYGFDYRQPRSPRLVFLAEYEDALYVLTSTFAFFGSQMFVRGGEIGTISPVVQVDNSQPRNVIVPLSTAPGARTVIEKSGIENPHSDGPAVVDG